MHLLPLVLLARPLRFSTPAISGCPSIGVGCISWPVSASAAEMAMFRCHEMLVVLTFSGQLNSANPNQMFALDSFVCHSRQLFHPRQLFPPHQFATSTHVNLSSRVNVFHPHQLLPPPSTFSTCINFVHRHQPFPPPSTFSTTINFFHTH